MANQKKASKPEVRDLKPTTDAKGGHGHGHGGGNQPGRPGRGLGTAGV